MRVIRNLYTTRPLLFVMLVALLLRLCATIWSKGYGMHDDHFLVVENVQFWVDDAERFDHWNPKTGDPNPSGHNLFYPLSQYLIHAPLEVIGITDPQSKMIVVRLLHALLSLLVVLGVYRIAQKISDVATARTAGIIMAALWIVPFLSVRNLIEVVAAVPIMWASWQHIKSSSFSGQHIWPAVLCGIAIGIRFQLVFFAAGWGLALLINKQWKGAFAYGTICLLTFALTQFGDLMYWSYPLTEIIAYVDYNIINATTYFNQPWYQYIFTIAGMLIPPVSLFLIFGFFKEWRRHLMLFLPAFVFLAFHSYFPNKQERFIFPALPYIILLGTVGFAAFKRQSAFWQRRKGLWKGILIWTITLNTLALALLTFTYSKRSRVESMTYLSKQSDFVNFTVDHGHRSDYILPPVYYADKWVSYDHITQKMTAERYSNDHLHRHQLETRPNYVLFYGPEKREQRIADFKKHVALLDYRTTIAPSNFDRLLHWLNPRNKTDDVMIYHIDEYHKQEKEEWSPEISRRRYPQ